MHNKRLKLKVQNAALLEEGEGRPQIFKNLRIYVSGEGIHVEMLPGQL